MVINQSEEAYITKAMILTTPFPFVVALEPYGEDVEKDRDRLVAQIEKVVCSSMGTLRIYTRRLH